MTLDLFTTSLRRQSQSRRNGAMNQESRNKQSSEKLSAESWRDRLRSVARECGR